MTEFYFQRTDVNIAALRQEIETKVGQPVTVSIRPDQDSTEMILVVTLDRGSSDSDLISEISRVVAIHDRNIHTLEQQHQKELEQQRAANIASPLDPTSFGAAYQPLRQLAERIAWLEKEIAHLVGGDM